MVKGMLPWLAYVCARAVELTKFEAEGNCDRLFSLVKLNLPLRIRCPARKWSIDNCGWVAIVGTRAEDDGSVIEGSHREPVMVVHSHGAMPLGVIEIDLVDEWMEQWGAARGTGTGCLEGGGRW